MLEEAGHDDFLSVALSKRLQCSEMKADAAAFAREKARCSKGKGEKECSIRKAKRLIGKQEKECPIGGGERSCTCELPL